MKTHKSLNLTTIFMYLFLGIVVSFSGFIAFGDEWTAEQKEVWESVEGFWDSIKSGDVESALISDSVLTAIQTTFGLK